MATVKAPLLSFGASGQLAKTLVYFPYKGLDVVRSHVVPANPNTAAQQVQRGYMTDAVDEWHAAGYTDGDHGAFSRWATTLGAGLSGFNAFVRSFINVAVGGDTWQRIAAAVSSAIGAAQFTVNVTSTSGGTAPVLHYGVSPTFMPNVVNMNDNTGNDWEATPTGLSSNTRYYWYISRGTPGGNYGRTGVYLTATS